MGEVGIEPTQANATDFTDQPNSPTLALSLVVGMARLELATPEGSGFTDQCDYLCHIIPICTTDGARTRTHLTMSRLKVWLLNRFVYRSILV